MLKVRPFRARVRAERYLGQVMPAGGRRPGRGRAAWAASDRSGARTTPIPTLGLQPRPKPPGRERRSRAPAAAPCGEPLAATVYAAAT